MADPAQIAHLLRRTEYVARPGRVSALSALTLEQAVDDILNIGGAVALPGSITYHDDNNGYDQWVTATNWWIDRMIWDSPKPFQEKMAWFWHSHFCTSWDKVAHTKFMTDQNKLFRDHALGNFSYLVQTMSKQPAMLLYLDNDQNRKKDPNQNFARELMELFTMGVGNYTEADVVAAARAWTGHTVTWDEVGNNRQYRFDSNHHDYDSKTLLGQTGNWDGPDTINIILAAGSASRLATCKYLTKKLWEQLAYQGPEQAVIDALAAVLNTNLEVKPWVRAMLLRPEFYSVKAQQGLIMQPVDWLVSLMYRMGLRASVVKPQWHLERTGQLPFHPPNVSGWRPNMYWVNTSSISARADLARWFTWRLRENDGHKTHEMTVPNALAYVSNLFGVSLSAPSAAALTNYMNARRATDPWGGWWESTNLLTMTMLTPECHVA